MDNEKMIKSANRVDAVAKVLAGICLGLGIACGVMGLLTAFLGEKMFGIADLSLRLSFLTLTLTENVACKPQMLRLFAVSGCLGAALMLVTCWYGLRTLRKILESMKLGRPFSDSTAGEVRKLGIFTLAFGGLGSLVKSVQTGLVAQVCPLDSLFNPEAVAGFETNVQFSLDFLWIAGLIFLLSYIFRYGSQLQRESDETL